MSVNESESELNLQRFYPEELKITNVTNKDNSVLIEANAKSKSCCCPKCRVRSTHVHGTYIRKAQDLPVLGKTTWLCIHAYEYQCDNPDCKVTTFAEDLNGFLSHYSRLTDRLEVFLCSLAKETSCESSARIAKSLGIRTSGDTVIRILERKFETMY